MGTNKKKDTNTCPPRPHPDITIRSLYSLPEKSQTKTKPVVCYQYELAYYLVWSLLYFFWFCFANSFGSILPLANPFSPIATFLLSKWLVGNVPFSINADVSWILNSICCVAMGCQHLWFLGVWRFRDIINKLQLQWKGSSNL